MKNWIALSIVVGLSLVAAVAEMDEVEPSAALADGGEEAGTGRFLASVFYPIFPQFYNIDYGSVLETYTRPDTIGYFVTRDVSAYFGVMAFWVLAHSLLWGGTASRAEDLGFPFNVMALLFGSDSSVATLGGNSRIDERDNLIDVDGKNYFEKSDVVQEKLNGGSAQNISINALYNFLTTPKKAAGNLFLSLGFGAFISLVWLLPTFLWSGRTLPENDTKNPNDRKVSERLGAIASQLENDADVVKVYNRLLCPQCIAQIAVINGVALTGKLLFWYVISLLPKDFPDIFLNPSNNFGLGRRFGARSFEGETFSARLAEPDRSRAYTLQSAFDRLLDDITNDVERNV